MKYVLITGASGDIGIDILESILLKTDLNAIAMCNQNSDRLIELKSKYNSRVEIIKCDFKDQKQIEDAKSKLSKYNIHSAIFCAGISKIQMINKMSSNDIADIINVNLQAPIELTTTVSDIMVRNKFGNIIYISSMWGIDGASCESVYSASKAGLIAFSKALSKELGPSNICVNTISPGFIDTKMNLNLCESDREDFIKEIPLMRAGKVSDISNLVLYLISDQARYISGANIKLDGGFI